MTHLDERLDTRVPYLLTRCRGEDGGKEVGEGLEAKLVRRVHQGKARHHEVEHGAAHCEWL